MRFFVVLILQVLLGQFHTSPNFWRPLQSDRFWYCPYKSATPNAIASMRHLWIEKSWQIVKVWSFLQPQSPIPKIIILIFLHIKEGASTGNIKTLDWNLAYADRKQNCESRCIAPVFPAINKLAQSIGSRIPNSNRMVDQIVQKNLYK